VTDLLCSEKLKLFGPALKAMRITMSSVLTVSSSGGVGTPWMWMLGPGHQQDRTPTHGYEATRQTAMQAFARSWDREV
jgi:hypothetical protein